MRAVAVGAASGIAAGVVTGAFARVAMRMVALGVTDPNMQVPIFTPEGTAAILGSGAIAGAPFGALYAWISRVLPGPRLARGALYAALLLATLGPLFFVGARDEFISGGRIFLFTWLFPVYGLAVAALAPLGERVARGRAAVSLLVLAAAGGAVLVGGGMAGMAGGLLGDHGTAGIAYVAPLLLLPVVGWAAIRLSARRSAIGR